MNKRLRPVLAALALPVLLCAGAPVPCDYYDAAAFGRDVEAAGIYEHDGTLLAGAVPHHLLAGRLIASFFATAARDSEPVETVLFVAPSHYPVQEQVVTALSGWQTPFGELEVDAPLTRRLISDGKLAARVNEENMRLDHAVSGLAPYVKYYLPEAKVAAVLMQNGLDPARVEAVARIAAEASQEKRLLLVASTDFSHYLTPEAAAGRDEETRRAIEAFDLRTIAGFRDDHVDSPQALTALLRYLQLRGVGQVSFFDHASAEQLLPRAPSDVVFRDGVTTYFVLGGVADVETPPAGPSSE